MKESTFDIGTGSDKEADVSLPESRMFRSIDGLIIDSVVILVSIDKRDFLSHWLPCPDVPFDSIDWVLRGASPIEIGAVILKVDMRIPEREGAETYSNPFKGSCERKILLFLK